MAQQEQRTGPLDAVGILVTRPALQAPALCRMLEALGARVARFAAIDIEPLPDPRTRAARIDPLAAFDLIIFASANAVRHGAGLLEQRRDLPLAAIGPATARALNQAGYRVSIQPDDGFDSEGLLRHPALAGSAGGRILLVKGEGGRDLLQQELGRRGVALSIAEVYRRICPKVTAEERALLALRFERGEIQAITATSLEIGRNLLELAGPGLRRHFDAAHWLVPSDRVAAALRGAGLAAPLLRAASAEDQDLVSELVRWRSSVSGA